MIVNEENIFFYWMERANRAGANGQRLIDIAKVQLNAGDDFSQEYVLCFDDGPTSASDKPWP